ncbi:MAG: recombination regulator RecX [Propionivibrio sp.]|jgi:regulatory protein|nr:recombination regulator RecX [Propionivibrio sp.]MBP6709911.1 recombination regulator RecX [Propionivibrio sp.]MBP7524105.1 recombination regulator RecX [Propionivibrio sp.]MBP8163783.1 recombination regulator RecX [Propionivibrio sp.]
MSVSLRERAIRMLARREHARAELARKLAPYAESGDEVEALLDDLTARRLLSDARYVEARINARRARFGDARLAFELRTQGVGEELVDAALATGDDELSRARLIWQRKFAGKPCAGDARERARQSRFLLSRGFSAETVRQVMRGDFEDD